MEGRQKRIALELYAKFFVIKRKAKMKLPVLSTHAPQPFEDIEVEAPTIVHGVNGVRTGSQLTLSEGYHR